ncbi:MAG: hypothetical protein HBSAPP01_27140 [Candidatus Brocadia sapporoensis]|nr:MAG: hypothetical protein HBSAPP01_27140 [Candidatus Brocadia sapporoensis]
MIVTGVSLLTIPVVKSPDEEMVVALEFSFHVGETDWIDPSQLTTMALYCAALFSATFVGPPTANSTGATGLGTVATTLTSSIRNIV